MVDGFVPGVLLSLIAVCSDYTNKAGAVFSRLARIF